MKNNLLLSALTLLSIGSLNAMQKNMPALNSKSAEALARWTNKTAAEIMANPDIVNANGDTPLLALARAANEDSYTQQMADDLFKSNVNVNYVNPNDKATPLIAALSIDSPKELGSQVAVSKRFESANIILASSLIAKGANVNAAAQNGVTPLMLAAKNGDNALVAELIKAGADVEAKDNNGLDASYYAGLNTGPYANQITAAIKEASVKEAR